MKGLTSRQRAVLDVISSVMDERGYPPTIREIGLRLGIKSTNGVNDHLKALERKGFLVRDKSKSRAIRLSDDFPAVSDAQIIRGPWQSEDDGDDDLITVPLIGRIAAGSPILADENRERTFRVDPGLLGVKAKHKDVFVLKVRGDSMIEAGIHDSDLIFVERCDTATPGEIVAAMVDGEATVKRFHRRGSTIVLEPANATMSDIIVDETDGRDVRIIGRVIGVFRTV
jgi:repressor LexA